jgi:hypothetical protein
MSDAAPMSPKALLENARERALVIVTETVGLWRAGRWPGVNFDYAERQLAARAPTWIGPQSVAAGAQDVLASERHLGKRIPVEDITRLSDLLTPRLQDAGILALSARRPAPPPQM